MMHMLNAVGPERSGWSDNANCLVLPKTAAAAAAAVAVVVVGGG
jgi:hypothetical protein